MTELHIPTEDLQQAKTAYQWLAIVAVTVCLALGFLMFNSQRHDSDCRAQALGAQVSGRPTPARDRC